MLTVIKLEPREKRFEMRPAPACFFFKKINAPMFMKAKLITCLLALTAALVSGCSTVEPGHYAGSAPLESLKTAYVVIAPDYDPKIGTNIVEALTRHGVTSQAGPLQEKPKDAAFYVEYEDHWRWDMAMYLYSLDVRFIDNTTGNTIGSGSFRQGAFHDFPNAREKTMAVVDSIYNAK
jgi:hypothetical protein